MISCGSSQEETVKKVVEEKTSSSEAKVVAETKVESSKASSLFIPQNLLNKKLLFSIAYTGANFSEGDYGKGLSSKIVSFEKKEGKIYVLEDLSRSLETNTLKTNNIIFQLPILSESEKGIVVNFKEGFKNFYVTLYGENILLDIEEAVFQEIQVSESLLFLSPMTKVRFQENDKEVVKTLNLKLRFWEYKDNPNFEKKVSPDEIRPKYFTTEKVRNFETNQMERYIIRFDHSKPITYYLSNEIPQEYREALKEGVLYWNSVFKKEQFIVLDLPEGISAYTPGYNIIWWVDHKQGDGAYADRVTDPWTGEVLQAHIYISSVYVSSTKSRTYQDLLDKLIRQDKPVALDAIKREEIMTKATQRKLTNTTAHEVGHTLGLRHNFMGSTASNLTPSMEKEIFEGYLLKSDFNKDTVLTSSVMDYLTNEHKVLQGERIHLGLEPGKYDHLAIEWGYNQKTSELKEFSVFCTDENKSSYADCNANDAYSNVFLSPQNRILSIEENIVSDLARSFLNLKNDYEIPVYRESVSTIALDPKEDASYYEDDLWNMGIHLRLKESYIADETQVSSDEQELEKSKFNFIQKQLEEVGGMSSLYHVLLKDGVFGLDEEELLNRFKAIIHTDRFRKGVNIQGESYEFNDEEIKIMEDRAQKYFKNFVRSFQKSIVDFFSLMNFDHFFSIYQKDDSQVKSLEEFIFKLTNHIVMKEAPEEIVIEKEIEGEKYKIDYKNFYYPFEMRRNSLGMIKTYSDMDRERFQFWRDFNRDNEFKIGDMLLDFDATYIELEARMKMNDSWDDFISKNLELRNYIDDHISLIQELDSYYRGDRRREVKDLIEKLEEASEE